MTSREIEEYKALRATIRERGTARVWLFVVGFALWTLAVVAVAALASLPVATLLPLLLLAAVFESLFALHTGVERIGRYLQVFYEDDADATGPRQWERTVMAFGRQFPSRGIDPLFTGFFVVATACNIVPAILAGAVPLEWSVIGTFHVLFLVRVFVARHHARQQRALELQQFEQVKSAAATTAQNPLRSA
jgi:hypothetical protein